jgi:hypothetical protein
LFTFSLSIAFFTEFESSFGRETEVDRTDCRYGQFDANGHFDCREKRVGIANLIASERERGHVEDVERCSDDEKLRQVSHL